MSDAGPSNEGSPVAGSSNPGHKRRQSRDGSEILGEKPSRKKQKHPRPVLSCSACVRRKSKCNQVVPCDQCIKRNTPEECVVEGAADAPKNPLLFDHDLRDRVTSLEGLVHSILLRLPDPTAEPRPPILPIVSNGSSTHHFNSPSTTIGTSFYRNGDLSQLPTPLASSAAYTSTASSPSPLLTGVSEVDNLASLLPDSAISILCLESYIERVDCCLHVIHVPSLRREFANLDLLRVNNSAAQRTASSGDEDMATPAIWLRPRVGKFLIVHALGLHFLPSHLSPYTPQRTAELVNSWVDAAESSLNLVKWSSEPSLRTVQIIAMMAWYWRNVGEIDRLTFWVGTAVRIARLLEMHIVVDPAAPPPAIYNDPDPAAARMAFMMKELGNQLWWVLCTFEWDVSFRCRNASVIGVDDFIPVPPHNLTDEDLLLGAGGAQPRPLTEWTPALHTICFSNVALVTQQWWHLRKLQGLDRGVVAPDIQTVHQMNRVVLQIASRFPPCYQLVSATPPEQSARLTFERLNLNKEIYIKRMRLNRRFVTFDATDEATLLSKKTSLESASVVLAIIKDTYQRFDFATKLWWVSACSVLAGTILLVDSLLTLSLPGPTPSDALIRQGEVFEAVTMLRSFESPSLHTIQGIRVLTGLITKLEEGRSRRAASKSFEFEREFAKLLLAQVAQATMATASDETSRLKVVADSLGAPEITVKRADSTNSGAAAIAAAAATPLPYGDLEALGDVNGWSPQEVDDFFRSLGFLPGPDGQISGVDPQAAAAGGGGIVPLSGLEFPLW